MESLRKSSPDLHKDGVLDHNRRRFLIYTGALGVSVLSGIAIANDVEEAVNTAHEIDVNVNQRFPGLPEQVVQQANEQLKKDAQKAGEFLKEGHIEEARTIYESPAHIDAQITMDRNRLGIEQRFELRKSFADPWQNVRMLGRIFLSGLSLYTVCESIHGIGNAMARAEEHRQRGYSFHPEWKDKSPSSKENREFHHIVSYLPPVGGKLIVMKNGVQLPVQPFGPTHTAEEHVSWHRKAYENNQLGEAYIHQISVQGRLPDKFKYVALALILNSPHSHNWEKPFYDAPWGKVAPLIHDGGRTKQDLNYAWRKVKGRTDFLKRMVITSKVNEEFERMTTEVKAYQRLALALHARAGTLPNHIPVETKEELMRIWDYFELTMHTMFTALQVQDVCNVPWFQSEPRDLWPGHPKRLEADWMPIQEQLIHLENVRKQAPELQTVTGQILKKVTNMIDKAIGLPNAA